MNFQRRDFLKGIASGLLIAPLKGIRFLRQENSKYDILKATCAAILREEIETDRTSPRDLIYHSDEIFYGPMWAKEIPKIAARGNFGAFLMLGSFTDDKNPLTRGRASSCCWILGENKLCKPVLLEALNYEGDCPITKALNDTNIQELEKQIGHRDIEYFRDDACWYICRSIDCHKKCPSYLDAIKALETEGGKESRSMLKTTLSSGCYETRALTSLTLGRMGDPRAIPVLKQLLSLTSESIWMEHNLKIPAIKAAGNLKDKSLKPQLLKCIEDENYTVSLEASATLAFLGNDHGLQMLKKFASHNDIFLRFNALIYLAQIKGEKWVRQIHKITKEEYDHSLENISLRPEDKLLRRMFRSLDEEKVNAYGSIGGREAIRGLRTILHQSDNDIIRRHAAWELLDLGQKDGLPTLKEEAQAEGLYRYNPELIKYLGPDLAFSCYKKGLRNSHNSLQNEAINAVSQTGNKRFLPILKDLLKKDETKAEAAYAILNILTEHNA